MGTYSFTCAEHAKCRKFPNEETWNGGFSHISISHLLSSMRWGGSILYFLRRFHGTAGKALSNRIDRLPNFPLELLLNSIEIVKETR